MVPVPADVNGNLDENEKSDGIQNPAFVSDGDATRTQEAVVGKAELVVAPIEKPGFLREFFDPALALSLVEVVVKKRDGNLRVLVWLVLLCNIVFLASLGESDLTYLYTRLKINWSGVEFVLHLTYGTAVALVGTLLMVDTELHFIALIEYFLRSEFSANFLEFLMR